jgi:nitric oxide dioxygenase
MSMVKKYRSEIVKIENPIEGVYTLTLQPETGKFRFSPGQFLHIAIDKDYDGFSQWPDSRCFSVQTTPAEDQLKITYSVKGSFTTQMAEVLKEGGGVWVKLPYGDLFDQPHNKEKTVFISGGTGITPYLSLFTDKAFIDYQSPVLYAGFRNEGLNLYKDEIGKAQTINPALSVHFIYQDIDGILNIEKIYQENGTKATYFVSGPPQMINTFKNKLMELGVAEQNILTDDWE